MITRIRLVCMAAVLVLFAACQRSRNAPVVLGGDVARGMAAASRFGCGSCHTIAGIPGAHGRVGPPLMEIPNRLYIAGMLENNPQSLIRWILDPHTVNAQTAMPNVGLTMQDAADIAAFLYARQ